MFRAHSFCLCILLVLSLSKLELLITVRSFVVGDHLGLARQKRENPQRISTVSPSSLSLFSFLHSLSFIHPLFLYSSTLSSSLHLSPLLSCFSSSSPCNYLFSPLVSFGPRCFHSFFFCIFSPTPVFSPPTHTRLYCDLYSK